MNLNAVFKNSSGNLCGTGLIVGKLCQVDCQPVSAEHASVALKQHSDLGLMASLHLNAQGSHPEEISE